MPQDVPTLKGIEQGRAKYAFASVGQINEALKKEYKTIVKKLPVLIKTNGLGQSLAFLKSKGEKDSRKEKNAHDKLYEQIGTWLQTEDVKGLIPQEGELVKEIIQLESHVYRQVTVETMALLNWIRRFADGLIED